MFITLGVAALLALGFGAGRVHHASQLKTKLTALEATAVGDAKAAYTKIKSLL
jgi:hypothetical protein